MSAHWFAPLAHVRGALALALLAPVSAAQLPDEQALLLEYGRSTLQAGSSSNGLAAADLDGDGDLEVISANATNNALRLWVNGAAGVFSVHTIAVADSPAAVAPADLDADGDIDLVVGCYTSLRVLANDGSGGFRASEPLLLPSSERGVIDLAVHDVDGDGWLDVLAGVSTHLLPSGGFTGSVVTALGDGTGALTVTGIHALPEAAHRLRAGDFDGDGLIDVAALGGYVSASKVDVAFGLGDGSFVNSGSQYNAGLYASGLGMGDWDGDGDLDLATGNKYGAPLFLNDGSGHFTAGQTLNPGYYSKGLAAGDLDGDGDTDLLVSSGSSYAMRLYRNDGAGSFSLAASVPCSLQTLSVLLADTNGDGYPDPWSGDYSTGQITAGASQALLARYGQSLPNSLACLPELTASGSPAADGPGLAVQAQQLLIDQPALVLASLAPGALPGLGGTLLVQPPWVQLPAFTSHGSGDPLLCDGSLDVSLDGALLGALGIGTRVYVQVLSADPGLATPPAVSLSNGLWFEVSAP